MNSSTQQQAINALPPDAQDGAKAMAPASDEHAAGTAQDLVDSPGFKEFLNLIADFASAQANSERSWERRRQTVKLRKMVLGEYYGIFDKTRGWVSGRNDGDGIYYDPSVATFIDTLVAQLVKSKPKKLCTARVPEMVDKREAARVAENLLAMDDDQDFTPKRQQREWKWNLLTAGETYRITFFNTNKPGCGVNREVYERVEIPGGDEAHFCVLCDTTSVSNDGSCAGCGNPQVDSYQTQGTTVTVKKGSKFEQIGDTDYDIPDALEMTVIGETDEIGGALIVMRDRMIPRCVLEDALGQSGLPDTDTPDRLTYKQLFDGKAQSDALPQFRLLHYQEFWIAPAVYASYKLPQDTKTKGGDVIPAGESAKPAFPEGMYFSRIKTEIYNLYPQSAAECITHSVNAIGEGFHGQGEWDLNELGDQLTEAKSMKMSSMLLDSTHPLLIREGVVDGNDFENKYGQIVTVPSDLNSVQLDDMMRRVPGEGLPDQAYELGTELKGQMQQRVAAFSTQSDAPDVKAMGTATGIAAITENTLGRRGPALALYAQMEVEQAYQKLEMRQKYWPKKMYSTLATDLGDDAVKWFIDCNIRQDINISVVPESWMPQTDAQKKSGLQTYLQIAGQLIAAKNDPKMLDDILRKTNEVFGAGLDLGEYESENVEAQLRLDKLRDVGQFVEKQFGDHMYDAGGNVSDDVLMLTYKQTAEMLRIVHRPSDAQDIFANLPIDVMFDDHAEFENSYTDWLGTAEGRAASSFVRLLVRQLAEYHLQATAYQQLKMAQYSKIPAVADLQEQVVAKQAMQETDPQPEQQAPEPPPHPMQKVSESMNYKDLPPSGQAQVAKQAGIDITEDDVKAHQTAQQPAPAQSKPKASPQPIRVQ